MRLKGGFAISRLDRFLSNALITSNFLTTCFHISNIGNKNFCAFNLSLNPHSNILKLSDICLFIIFWNVFDRNGSILAHWEFSFKFLENAYHVCFFQKKCILENVQCLVVMAKIISKYLVKKSVFFLIILTVINFYK